MDFKERSESYRKAVLDILRTEYGEDEDREILDDRVAWRIALLYTKRENELLESILKELKDLAITT